MGSLDKARKRTWNRPWVHARIASSPSCLLQFGLEKYKVAV